MLGEEWEDGHCVNWYWFYVSKGNYDILMSSNYLSMASLTEWRGQEAYQKKMSLIKESFAEEKGNSNHPDKDDKNTDIDHSEYRTNVIKTEASITEEVKQSYQDFLNNRIFIQSNGEIMLADDIINSLYTLEREYALYDVTGDDQPELILQGRRLYILTYQQGNLSVLFEDEYYNGVSYFVNGGKLYYRSLGIANESRNVYGKMDVSGNFISKFSVNAYYESEKTTYVYCAGDGEEGEERELTKQEYDELIRSMSEDEEIDWQNYYETESILSKIHY